MSRVRRCPRCDVPLQEVQRESVQVDKCAFCKGTFFDAGEAQVVLGQEASTATWRELWATDRGRASKLKCPVDRTPLTEHTVRVDSDKVVVDHCEACDGTWFDHGEGQILASIAKKAQHEAELRASGKKKPGIALYLFQLATGMPLEVWNPVRSRPVVVFSLAGFLLVLFFLQFFLLPIDPKEFGRWTMVPAQVLSGTNVHTIVTSGFFHANLAHVLGNLYFLWLFGDNVEDTLGWRRFSLIYVFALIAGSVAQAVTHPHDVTRVLGASGAVAGLMGAYMVLFPKAKVWIMIIFWRVPIRARWYLAFWVGLQVLMQSLGAGGVAWFAHLGGFFIGAMMALVLRPDPQASPKRALT